MEISSDETWKRKQINNMEIIIIWSKYITIFVLPYMTQDLVFIYRLQIDGILILLDLVANYVKGSKVIGDDMEQEQQPWNRFGF